MNQGHLIKSHRKKGARNKGQGQRGCSWPERLSLARLSCKSLPLSMCASLKENFLNEQLNILKYESFSQVRKRSPSLCLFFLETERLYCPGRPQLPGLKCSHLLIPPPPPRPPKCLRLTDYYSVARCGICNPST